jgi:acyl dehydratase
MSVSEPRESRTTLDRSIPIRYAELSGDGNPIHLDDEAARAVGLPSTIVHGMYLFGLAMRAALVDEDPRLMLSARARFLATSAPDGEVIVRVQPTANPDGTMTAEVRVQRDGRDILGHAAVTVRMEALP